MVSVVVCVAGPPGSVGGSSVAAGRCGLWPRAEGAGQRGRGLGGSRSGRLVGQMAVVSELSASRETHSVFVCVYVYG